MMDAEDTSAKDLEDGRKALIYMSAVGYATALEALEEPLPTVQSGFIRVAYVDTRQAIDLTSVVSSQVSGLKPGDGYFDLHLMAKGNRKAQDAHHFYGGIAPYIKLFGAKIVSGTTYQQVAAVAVENEGFNATEADQCDPALDLYRSYWRYARPGKRDALFESAYTVWMDGEVFVDQFDGIEPGKQATFEKLARLPRGTV